MEIFVLQVSTAQSGLVILFLALGANIVLFLDFLMQLVIATRAITALLLRLYLMSPTESPADFVILDTIVLLDQ